MSRRERDIREMVAQGHHRLEICDQLGKKYNVSKRTIEHQYYQIVNEIADQLKEHRSEIAFITLERQNLIYNKAMEKQQLKTALDAVIATAKLARLYDKDDIAPKVPEISIVQGDFSMKAVGDGDEE